MADYEIGQPELCDVLGITPQSMGQLVKSGVVVKLDRGSYDLRETCKRYIASQRRQAQQPDLTAARVKLTEAKAEVADMARRRALGQAVDIEDVAESWAAMVTTFRTRMLAIPAKVAARVRMASTIVEVAGIIREEITMALDELSRGRGEPGGPPAAA